MDERASTVGRQPSSAPEREEEPAWGRGRYTTERALTRLISSCSMSATAVISVPNVGAASRWNFSLAEAFLFTASALTLGLIVPLALMPSSPHATLALFILLATTTYTACRLMSTMLGRDRSLARFFFWSFAYVFFGLVAVVQVASETFPQRVQPTMATVLDAAILDVIFMVAFDITWKLAPRHRTPRTARRELTLGRVQVLAVIAMAVSLYEIRTHGGVGSLIHNRQTFTAAFSPGTNGLGLINLPDKSGRSISVLLLGAPVFIAAYCFLVLRRKLNQRLGALGVLTVAWALFVSSPISQPRQWSGTVIISLFLAWRGPLSRRWFVGFGYGVLFILLVLYPFAGRLFRFAPGGQTVPSVSVSKQFSELPDYDAFQQVASTIGYVDRNGFTDGKQIAANVLFWLPRKYWAGKPHDAGYVVGTDLGYASTGNTNLSSPMPAEAYIDGGVPLVVVYGVLVGWVVRRADDYLASTSGWSPFALLVPVMAVYQLIILRGPLLPTVGTSIALALMLVLVCKPINVRALAPGSRELVALRA